MAKATGLGQRFNIGQVGAAVGAYNIGSNIGSLGTIRGGPNLLEFPDIEKSAMVRLGGLRDGELSFQAWLDPDVNMSHDALSTLPNVDVIALLFTGTTLGDSVAAINAKQVNYDPSRGADGSIALTVQCLANSFGLEWCELLFVNVSHAAATNGSSIDFGAGSTLFGASAYVLVQSLASGTMTPVIQDSADNVSFAAITGMTFSGVTPTTNLTQRVQSSATQTIRRYVRGASTNTFTNAVWSMCFVRHLTATL